MMKFYYAPYTCALASHIALEEAGADYEAVRVDLKGGQQLTQDYLAMNPKGRVPVLVTDRGIITETPAILAYVAQTHPASELAPLDDPFAFAEVQSLTSYLCSTVHPGHSHGIKGARWADDPAAHEAMRARVPQNMTDYFTVLENRYFRGPWIMGDTYTIVDPYLFTISGWLKQDHVDINKFPRVADHYQRMQQRPAVAKVVAEELGKA
jgi:glutathione S-transferase